MNIRNLLIIPCIIVTVIAFYMHISRDDTSRSIKYSIKYKKTDLFQKYFNNIIAFNIIETYPSVISDGDSHFIYYYIYYQGNIYEIKNYLLMDFIDEYYSNAETITEDMYCEYYTEAINRSEFDNFVKHYETHKNKDIFLTYEILKEFIYIYFRNTDPVFVEKIVSENEKSFCLGECIGGSCITFGKKRAYEIPEEIRTGKVCAEGTVSDRSNI